MNASDRIDFSDDGEDISGLNVDEDERAEGDANDTAGGGAGGRHQMSTRGITHV